MKVNLCKKVCVSTSLTGTSLKYWQKLGGLTLEEAGLRIDWVKKNVD